jgi:hypothetical protein
LPFKEVAQDIAEDQESWCKTHRIGRRARPRAEGQRMVSLRAASTRSTLRAVAP